MADKTPVAVDSHSPSSQTADDGSLTDITSGMTDDDTAISIFKIGKDDDACRIEFQGDFPPSVGDTVTWYFVSTGHNVTFALELYAHIDGNSVSTNTHKLVIASPATGANVFTLDATFIAELALFNTDRWAVRVVIDDFGNGDWTSSEVQADIVQDTGNGGLSIPVAMYNYRRRRAA